MTKTDYIYRYNLNRLRKEYGLTFQQLEDLTTISRFTLSRMHRYTSTVQPHYCFDRFEAFAAIYGIEVYELFIPPEDIVYPDNLEKSYYLLSVENQVEPHLHKGPYTHPHVGHFSTNLNALEWHLISPTGEEYSFKNILLWAEEHENLLPVFPKTGQRVKTRTFVREMRRVKSGETKNYRGWKLKNNSNQS